MEKSDAEELVLGSKILEKLTRLEPVCWFSDKVTDFNEALSYVGLSEKDVREVAERLDRFSAYFKTAFPETKPLNGLLESPLVAAPSLQAALQQEFAEEISGNLFLKMDALLPISGSIKARGGIHEVLCHAEKLALDSGMLSTEDDYAVLNSQKFRNFFSKYKIAVGSTGNLGLSVGIMGATLGFEVSIHMSSDARQWKKDRLRALGVNVCEYDSDYSVAVARGRKEAEFDDYCHFVDDENSKELFLGYAVAGQRLKRQLEQQKIKVDREHPLFVYLPCGVGGGPGGVAFGLKLAFKENVHCFFAEPTQSPCMLIGVYTGLHDDVCVEDFGIENRTAADGLAVGRASGFVGRAMERMIDGYFTVEDEQLFKYIRLAHDTEKVSLEPSAVAGIPGPNYVSGDKSYLHKFELETSIQNATHIIWATGGGMVPDEEMQKYLSRGT